MFRWDLIKFFLSCVVDDIVDLFVKVVLRFSYVFFVVIVMLNDIFIKEGFGVLFIMKFLLVIDFKEVVLFVLEDKFVEWKNVISGGIDCKLLKKIVGVGKIEIRDGSLKDDVLKFFCYVLLIMEGFKLDDVCFWWFIVLVVCDGKGEYD